MRARGGGESDQGTAAEAVCRSDLDAPHEEQSAAPLVFLGGLQSAAHAQVRRFEGDPVGQGAMPDDSPQTVEDWGADSGQCPAGESVLERGLSLPTALWSGRNTTRAAVGGEFPERTLSVVRRVPSSTLAHVSASPLCHPGRSDFPSPVGDHDFPPTVFPYPTRLKRSLAFTPLGCGLPPVSTKLALSPHTQVLSPGRWALPCPPWPRVPSPFPGIILPGAASRRLGPALPDLLRSYGLMRQTWMLRGPSLSLGPSVFAGCCEPLLQTGPSRHYLCNPCPGAWTPTRR